MMDDSFVSILNSESKKHYLTGRSVASLSYKACCELYLQHQHLADNFVEWSVRPTPLQILATLAAFTWLKTRLRLKIWHFFTFFTLALQHPGTVWLDTCTVCSVCPTFNLFNCTQAHTVFQRSLQLCFWLLFFFLLLHQVHSEVVRKPIPAT